MNPIAKVVKKVSVRDVTDYLYLTFGLFLYAFGWVLFLLPNSLMSGGLTGICSLIFYATHFPPSYSYFLINVVLLIFALKILGLKFLTRTIYGIFVLSFFIGLLQKLATLPDGSLFLLLGPNEIFMSITIGGLICGTALAIIFLHSGSTGGTDIIAASINKYRDISMGHIFIVTDVFIIGSSFLVLKDWHTVVLGYIFAVLESVVLDYVMKANRASVQFFIFSKHYEEIAQEIGTKVQRGITILKGQGWYSKQEVKLLCILAKKQEANLILRIIKSLDPNAFVSVGSVHGVYGEGFDPIKIKAKKKKEIEETMSLPKTAEAKE